MPVNLVNLLPEPWKPILDLDVLAEISENLKGDFLPETKNIFRALTIEPAKVKVIILGQDPYPNPKHAMGLAFSVNSDVTPLPSSLRNIFTELENDLGYKRTNGDLSDWNDQ